MFTQTFWTQLSTENTLGTSTSAVTENNVSFQANGFPGAAAYLAAFDQYCIYAVVLTISYLQENSIVTSSVQNVRVHTALDYDNQTNIGLPALQSFSTYSAAEMSPNTSVLRYVKPCLSGTIQGGGGARNAASIERSWIDSATNDILHYGVRIILGQTVLSTVSVTIGFSAVFGFRNGI
jgi:hypothetical protein